MELVHNNSKIDEYKKRARQLVEKMTLDEKIFQMLHSAPAIERLEIKAYNWWNESLHGVARAGVATVFPQAISLAASFDEDFLEEIADAIATEGRAKFNMQQKYGDADIYKGLTFWSPNVNIFRDPRWGRGHETYGEDPYLSSRLGVRYIQGLQGHDENFLKAAACAKHFAVHSGPEDLRHSFNAVVSKQDLYETYLPAFKACVKDAQVEAVMGAYNRTNDEPCCGSKMLLVDILRGEWGFDGHVVSDCWAIKDFHLYHNVTNSPAESAALAVNNGCDINCGNMFVYLLQAVKDGLITEEKITESVIRLFTTRMKLGMFDDSDAVPFSAIGYDKVDSEQMKQLNLNAARKSIVLLKNEKQLLPLNIKNGSIKSIGVIGPNANNRRALVGNYEGTASKYITVLEGVQNYLEESNSEARVYYSEGCHLHKERISALGFEADRIAEVKGVCDQSDVIIACMGLDPSLEGEEGDEGNEFASGDKLNLELPGLQFETLKTIYESGKPVILVLLSGSALAINWADENIPSIIQGWYPGALGGRAIAEAIFGKFSPEGKLPVTFYRTTDELPEFTDYSMKDRTYRYMKEKALYPFGYGLSYSSFSITDISADTGKLAENGVNISLKIKNNGSIEAAETIQVYVKAKQPGTPNPQLKGLKKVLLRPEEVKEITLHLPVEAFCLYDEEGDFVLNKCEYDIYIGTSQPDLRSFELTGVKPYVVTLIYK